MGCSRVTAFKIIKEPPDGWEVEITSPMVWAGRFRSLDGVAWWSPKLDRPLVENNENPGEARMLEGLRAIVRGHRLTRLLEVADAARTVVNYFETQSGAAIPCVEVLRSTLLKLAGKPAAALAERAMCFDADHHNVRRAEDVVGKYLPTEDPE